MLKPPVHRLEFASQLAVSLPSSIPYNPFLIPSRSLGTHSCHSNTPVVISRQPVSTNATPITHLLKLNLQTRTVILPKPVQVSDYHPDRSTRSGRKLSSQLPSSPAFQFLSQLFHHSSHHRTHFSFFITVSIIALISVLISAFTALSAHCSHSALSAHCIHLIVALLNPILDHIPDHIADHIADHFLDPIFDHILYHYF
ncbi:hypothetical protein FHG87_022391 [Trinorchestia longiramus]|nr:hypothetical protein FHG87_022391 [Trinorchestia longiramus]